MDTTIPPRANVTNSAIADKLEIAHTTVSRLRSGARMPSIDMMTRISHEFDWSIEKQVEAYNGGYYAERFEQRLIAKYGEV